MLERVSAFQGMVPVESGGIRMAVSADFALTQVVGDAKALKAAFPKLPTNIGIALDYAGKSILRVGPAQIWIVGAPPEAHFGLHLIALSSSRIRITLLGPRTREILAKGAAIDFYPKVFTPGKFVMTGIHHMPVLIHCVEPDMFHLYVMRTFALTMWEVLTDAAHS